MRTFVVFVALLISSNVSLAQSQKVFFQEHPSINIKVEEFSNALVESLLPQFSKTEVKFERDSNGDIINQMNQGYVSGEFTAVYLHPTSQSEIQMQFLMDMEIEEVKKKEYQINFKAKGSATHPSNFIELFNSQLKERCQLKDSPKETCLVTESFNTVQPVSSQALELFTLWKSYLLEKLSTLEDPGFEKIRAEFIDYIDERFQILKTDNSTVIDINFSDLAATFRKDAGRFLNQRKLIDYSVHNIHIEFTNDEMFTDLHFVKYHLIKPFNGLIQVAKHFQSTIEDPQAGQRIGEALSENFGSLKSSFLSESHNLDFYRAAVEFARVKQFGSKNENTFSEEEQDLGLE